PVPRGGRHPRLRRDPGGAAGDRMALPRLGRCRAPPLPDSFVHAEWITLHDNPDFRAFVDFLRSELDAAGPARAAVAREYFDRTVQLELDFFEQIYSRSTA